MCTSRGELLVDSCFDKGDGEAVGYESPCDSMRETSGNDDGQGETQIRVPFQALIA
jgi:hypothetical protein